MKKLPSNNLLTKLFLSFCFILLCSNALWAQTTYTAFTDNFDRATLSPGGTPSLTWTTTTSGTNTPTAVTNGSTILRLSNNTTAGNVFTYVDNSSFSTPYDPSLGLSGASGIIEWVFNARGRGSITSASRYAVVLAADGTNFNSASGYALYYRKGTAQRFSLARFTGGVMGTVTDIIGEGTNNDLAALTNYASIRITYNPTNNQWSLYIRDDGASAFTSPISTAVTTLATTDATARTSSQVTNNTYVSNTFNLKYSGFYWIGSTATTTSGDFDNFRVTQVHPISVGALATFGSSCINTPSTSQSFTLSAAGLPSNAAVVIGPLTNYTFSTDDISYSSSVSITPSSNAITSRSIYVKSSPSSTGAYTGQIPITGGGTTKITVATSGTGINTAAVPTTGGSGTPTSTTATLSGSYVIGCSSVTVNGIEYSTTNGFANGTGTLVAATGTTSFSASLTGLTPSTIYYYKAKITDGTGTIYGSQQSFTTATPSLTTSVTSLSSFNYLFGSGPSTSQSFTVSGTNLTGDAVITAPTNNFEVCLTSNGTYTNTVSITPSSGTITAVSVFVRLKAGLAVTSYSEALTVVSGSTSATNVSCSGSVSPLTPTLVAGTLTAFGNQCINTSSAFQSFNISGTNLTTADITVGPLTGYIFSTTSGGTYTSSLTITQGGGTLASTPIYVQFAPTSAIAYNGNVPVGGGGAATVNVAVTGTGLNTPVTVTTTSGATSITATSATIAGSYVLGCSAVTATGFEYSTTNGFTNGTGTLVSATGTSTPFSSGTNITGLSPSTTYYFKARVTDGSGTVIGTQQSFTTATPSVSISALSGTFTDRCIGTTSTTGTARNFTISGSNLTSANVVISQPGFIFSLVSASGYASSLTLTPSSGAIASTTIYVRFSPTEVKNYNGTGAITGGGLATAASFTVSANGINSSVSAVTTGAASSITGISATVAGSYTVGCSTATANGIAYSTTSGFANGTGTLVAGTAIGATFTANLTGLAPSTTYYYRTVVTDNSGSGLTGSPATYYGATEGSFTTATPALSISTTIAGTYNGGAFSDRCIGTTTSTGGARSFTLSGTNLSTADIVITLDGFLFSSTGSTGTYSSPLTITQSGGTFSRTIWVRFAPTQVKSYNGTFVVTGGGLAASVNGVFPNVNGINTTATTTTVAASSITATTATLNGTYATATCSGAITVDGFEYSTTNGFANGSGTSVAATGTTTFNSGSNLTGLVPNTTYYYKSKITDATIGSTPVTVYGSQLSFTTANIDAPVATAATSIAADSFTANWNASALATGYLLDVFKSDVIAGWKFPATFTATTSPIAADIANVNNTSSSIDLSSGTISPANGSNSYAGSATNWSTGKYWEVTINTTDTYNLSVSSAQYSSASGPRDFKLTYKIGTSGSSVDVPGGTITVGNGEFTTGTVTSLALPKACENKPVVILRWVLTSTSTNASNTGTVSSTGVSRIDNILIKGNTTTPISGYSNLSVASTSKVVTGLNPSTDYFYQVRANAPTSTSANSNGIAVITKADQSDGNFRTKSSGSFATASIWEYYDGSSWFDATVAPTSNNNVLISSGTEVSLDGNKVVGTDKIISVAGTLNFMGKNISGTGNFTLSSGATMKLGNNVSIATAVTSTGSNNFDSAANYIYDGTTVAQTTTLLPSPLTGNATIDNPAGVDMNNSKVINSPGSLIVTANGNLIFGIDSVTNVSGTGNFSAATGCTLVLTSSNGIANDGATGAIRLTGTRTFSPLINYNYTKNDIYTFLTSNLGTSFGTEITSINNLTINNPYGVYSTADITVSGDLIFTAGNFVTGTVIANCVTNPGSPNCGTAPTGANPLGTPGTYTIPVVTPGTNTITVLGSVIRTSTGLSSGYVAGNLTKNITTSTSAITYEIGDFTDYRPIDLNFSSVSSGGYLTASVSQTPGLHPQNTSSKLNVTKSVNRYYTLSASGLVYSSYNATFNYLTSDILNNTTTDTNNFIIGKYNNPDWSYPAVGTKTSLSTQATGLSSFGEFEIGEIKTTPTVTVNVDSYTYNGSEQGPNSIASLSPSPTTVTYSYVGVNGTVYGPTDTRPTKAGDYTATATVVEDGYYLTANSAATAFTILQKSLTLIDLGTADKVFDNTSDASFSIIPAGPGVPGTRLAGLIPGDTVGFTPSGYFYDGVAPVSNVGTWAIISTTTLTDTDSGNYYLIQPTFSAPKDITPLELTVSGFTASNKAYDGTTDATVNVAGASLVGVLGGQSVTLNSGSVTGAFDTKNVGNGKTVTAAGFTISGPNASNYALTQPTTTANITPVALTITSNDFSSCAGTPFATANRTEFTKSIDIAGDITTVTLTPSPGNGSVTGDYTLTPSAASGPGVGNYTISYVAGNLHVYSTPTAVISGSTAACLNESPLPLVTFTGANGEGTVRYRFYYTLNGGTERFIDTASGSSTATIPVLTSTTRTDVYALTRVLDLNTTCQQAQSGSATLVIGLCTQLRPKQCGKVLPDIATAIEASPVVGATQYRFEVTRIDTNTVYPLITSSLYYFYPAASIPGGLLFGKSYSIRVQMFIGTWLNYGSTCIVTAPNSPPIVPTKIRPMQCGQTLATINTQIQASPVYGATQYQFSVTPQGGTETIVTSSNYFFSLLSTPGLAVYSKAYAIKVNVLSGGNWTGYGDSCIVTTPALPTTRLITSQCGVSFNNLTFTLNASPVSLVTKYRFRVVNGATERIAEVNRTYIVPSDLVGGYANNTVYTVDVATLYNGLWSAYGPACTVSTPFVRMAAQDINSNVFEVKAFPNPFAKHFSLDIQSSSDDLVQVRVYDMIGRELEVQKATVSELSTREIGTNYPSGVYNVVVSQGDKVRSVRMIKR